LEVAGDDEDAVMVAQLELARNRANEGDFSGAIALYSAMGERVTDRPTQAAMQLSIAQVHAQSGDTRAARIAYETVLARYGNLVDTRFECQMGLAHVDRLEGKTASALERYGAVEAADVGSDIWRLEQLAQTHWELDDAQAARQAYEYIQDRYPDQAAALTASKNGLANIARAAGDLELARGLFNQVAELARESSQREWAKLSAAGILSEQGRYDDAFFALREVVATTSDPEVTLHAKLGMAAVFQEKGRFEQALELLDTADVDNLGPAWAASLTQAQVSSELALGKLDTAEARWLDLLNHWSDHDEAKSQAQLGLAEIALQKGKHQEAIQLFTAVAEGSMDRFFQVQARIGLGRVLVANGQPKEAADRLEAVLRDYPDQPEMLGVAQATLDGMVP
jgi:tetratricopeptide (TPR) repeat protein